MQILVHKGIIVRTFKERVRWEGHSLVEVSTGQHRGDNMNPSEYILTDIPDQDLPREKAGDAPARIIARYPEDVVLYSNEEQAKLIDRDTGRAIDEAIHPFAGIEEQIAILRDQLVHVINELGLTPTADFERLNQIAVEKVQEGAAKKEAL